MIKDNEAFYDSTIYPKMAEIIALCKAADLPFFATFHLAGPTEDAGNLYVSSAWEGHSPVIRRYIDHSVAVDMPPPLRMRIVTRP